MSLSDALALTDARRVWERERSTRDLSVRQMRRGCGPHHIQHRFPIKGGISAREILALNVAQSNAVLERLRRPK